MMECGLYFFDIYAARSAYMKDRELKKQVCNARLAHRTQIGNVLIRLYPAGLECLATLGLPQLLVARQV